MDIRFAKPADVPGILNLLRQVGQVHHQGRPDLFRNGAQKYGASGILSLMNAPQTPIFVAVEERKVLGYCFCKMQITDHDPVITTGLPCILTICAWRKPAGDSTSGSSSTARWSSTPASGGAAPLP